MSAIFFSDSEFSTLFCSCNLLHFCFSTLLLPYISLFFLYIVLFFFDFTTPLCVVLLSFSGVFLWLFAELTIVLFSCCCCQFLAFFNVTVFFQGFVALCKEFVKHFEFAKISLLRCDFYVLFLLPVIFVVRILMSKSEDTNLIVVNCK